MCCLHTLGIGLNLINAFIFLGINLFEFIASSECYFR